MKYEDFWSIYFTILRILLIFYLTHICIYLFNYHHPSYLSETASFLPMFLLLILNYCCSDGIIVEASDEFGYRVWFLVYRVWCFHPSSWTGSLPASCHLASWQCQHPASCFIRILVSSLLVVVHPVGSLQVLVVHYSYWFAVVVSRRPKPVTRRSLWSRQLSRQCVADPWWWFLADNIRDAEDMKFDDGWCRFTRDMSVWILSCDFPW